MPRAHVIGRESNPTDYPTFDTCSSFGIRQSLSFLQYGPSARFLVRDEGFEPSASAFQARHSNLAELIPVDMATKIGEMALPEHITLVMLGNRTPTRNGLDCTVLSPAFAKALFLSFVGSGGQEFYEIFDSFSAVIPQAFRLTRFKVRSP